MLVDVEDIGIEAAVGELDVDATTDAVEWSRSRGTSGGAAPVGLAEVGAGV